MRSSRAARRVVPHRQVLRARIILMAAEGVANQAIADRLGTSRPSVLKWRARFEEAGIDGLEEAEGRGPKPTYGQDFVERVIATALRPPGDGSTHWSTRGLAQQVGASHATVHRILLDAGLRPHLTRTFKYSHDPLLEEKVKDVVGLYMNPPENAIVLSVDEKTQIQALDRTQPLLPMRPARSSATPTITSAMAPPVSSRLSISPPGPSPAAATRSTGLRSSSTS